MDSNNPFDRMSITEFIKSYNAAMHPGFADRITPVNDALSELFDPTKAIALGDQGDDHAE